MSEVTKKQQKLCAAYAYIMLNDKRNGDRYGMQAGYGNFDDNPENTVHYSDVMNWLAETHNALKAELEGRAR